MITMTEYYSGAYEKILGTLPEWKRRVVVEDDKEKNDRIVEEFLKEVIKTAESEEFQKNFKKELAIQE